MSLLDLINGIGATSPAKAVEGETEWSDYPKAVSAGAWDISGQVRSGLASTAERWGYTDEAQRITQQAQESHQNAQDAYESMTPAAQASQSAGITSGEFWAHPGRAAALKGARMAPGVAAMIGSGAVAGPVGAVAAGAGFGAAQYADAIRSSVDAKSDDELFKSSEYYAGLRSSGMDEQQARMALKQDMEDHNGGLALNAIVGGASNAVGLGGVAGRAMTGGVLTRMGKEAALAGLPNAAQAAYGDYSTQSALQNRGLQGDVDFRRTADVALEAGVVGAVPGAAHGAFSGKRVPTTPEVGGDAAQNAALKAAQPPKAAPAPEPQAGAGQAAPSPAKVADPSVGKAAPAPIPAPDPVAAKPVAPTVKPAPMQVEGSVTVAPEAPTPRIDKGQTTPEAPATLQAQEQAMQAGQRPVVMYPDSKGVPKTPKGMKRIAIDGDVFHYDPAQIDLKDLRAAVRQGKLNELLGLGPVTKTEVVERVQAGEQPVGVVERTPEGVEVKAAAGTEQTAPEQVAAIEALKARPENTVAVENPDAVVAKREAAAAPQNAGEIFAPIEIAEARAARQGRILQDQSAEGKALTTETNAKITQNLVEAQKEAEGPKPGNRTKAELENRQANNAAADAIVARITPPEAPDIWRDMGARKAVYAYAKALVDAAKQEGVSIPDVDRGNVDAERAHSNGAMLLNEARALVKTKVPKLSQFEEFLTRDQLLRKGAREEVRAARKEQAEAAMRTDQGDVNEPIGKVADALSDDTTPETIIARKVDEDTATDINPEFEKQLKKARVREVAAEGRGIGVQSQEGKFKVETKPKRRSVTHKGNALYLENPDGTIPSEDGSKSVRPAETVTVADVLSRIDYSKKGGVAGFVMPMIAAKLKKIVGDVKVHIVDDITAYTGRGDKPYGLYHPEDKHIVMSDHVPADRIPHAYLHEPVHAATSAAIRSNPQVRAEIRAIMDEALAIVKNVYMPVDEFSKVKKWASDLYAFKNEEEFVAESMSNKLFQELMARTPISPELAERLGVPTWAKKSLWSGWVSFVRRILQLPEKTHTALEAIMSVTERIAAHPYKGDGAEMSPAPRLPELSKKKSELWDRLKTNGSAVARKALYNVSNLGMLARYARGLFGEADPAAEVYKGRMAWDTEKNQILERDGGAELVDRMGIAERKWTKTDPDAWNELGGVLFESTLYDLNPDGNNPHFGKNNKKYWQAKERSKSIEARFAALPEELRELGTDLGQFFRDQRNLVALDQIRALLKGEGIDDEALVTRIHEETLTDADKEMLGKNELLRAVSKANEFKKIHGLYVPLRRYGDYVVTASQDIVAPPNAIKISDDTIQFTSSGNKAAMLREAEDFLKRTDYRQRGRPKEVYVDKKDPTVILDSSDVDAIPALRVRLHNREVHMAESPYDAKQTHGRLSKQTDLKVNDPELKRDNPYAQNTGLLSSQMEAIVSRLRKRIAEERGKAVPDTVEIARLEDVAKGLYEHAAAMRAGSRLKSTMLNREDIAGFSRDLLRVTAEYADMAADARAKLHHLPGIEANLKAMQDYIKSNTTDGKNLLRSELYREVESRVYGLTGGMEHSPTNRAIYRLLQLSQLDKLGGVSFHLINLMEPSTTTLPMLAGRHGVATAMGNLSRAYSLIGGLRAMGAGLKDMGKAFSHDHGFTDYLKFFKDNINAGTDAAEAKRLGELLDYINDNGLLSKDAEFEVRREAHPEAWIGSRALDRADLMLRQPGQAAEGTNRAASAVAAYLGEYKKNGGDHKAAINYAFDIVHDTMGDYSKANAAPIFNHPLGRMALQFKKYGQKQYFLWGTVAKGALKNPEQRKQFAGLLFTHAVAAGALGLPLEPIKAALTASSVLAGTSFSWEDFEREARKIAKNLLGETGGEMATRGVTRGLPFGMGFDLSSRMGQESLLLYGSPRSGKDNDLKSWLFETVAGAPASLVLQQVKAIQSLFGSDNWSDTAVAASKLVPLKAVHDVTAATTGYLKGKETGRGYQSMKPYSLQEAGLKAIGLRPEREAENAEKRTQNYRMSVRQKAEHDQWTLKWAKATPGERAKLWGQVEQWNRDRPKEARLTRSALDAEVKRRQTKLRKGQIQDGQQVHKQNKYIIKENEAIYGDEQ